MRAVMEKGALYVIDLRHAVCLCPEAIVFGREGLGEVSQVVIVEDRLAEYRQDDRSDEEHLYFGVLIMFEEPHQ